MRRRAIRRLLRAWRRIIAQKVGMQISQAGVIQSLASARRALVYVLWFEAGLEVIRLNSVLTQDELHA